VAGEAAARAADEPALRPHDEVFDRGGGGVILGEIHARAEARRDFATGEGGLDDENSPGEIAPDQRTLTVGRCTMLLDLPSALAIRKCPRR
jgi:hypothetical protein